MRHAYPIQLQIKSTIPKDGDEIIVKYAPLTRSSEYHP